MFTVRTCQNFLTLVTGIPVDITGMRVRCGHAAWAEIIMSLTRANKGSHLYGHDPVVHFNDLPRRRGKIVENWFSIQPELREVINLILGFRYVRGYMTTEFLNLAQGLEAFHRRMFKGRYYGVGKYDAIRGKLQAQIPLELKSEFRKKLQDMYVYANEYNFRMRLKELYESVGPKKGELDSKAKAFIGKVVKTRNYLTHLDETGRGGSFMSNPDDLRELGRANLKLNAIATYLLLKEIGVAENVAAKGAFRWV
jgi:hypothetical protein